MNISRHFLILCSLLLNALTMVYGQEWHIRHYDTDDGLPHDVVYQVRQDSKGYLWVCTDDGLARFDGTRWDLYGKKQGLLSNYIIDIAEDTTSGAFYIATWGEGIHIMENDTILPISYQGKINNKDHSVLVNDEWMVSWGFSTMNVFERTPQGLVGEALQFASFNGQMGLYAIAGFSNLFPKPPPNTISDPAEFLPRVAALLMGENLLICCERSGIWKIDKTTRKLEKYALDGISVWNMHTDGDGGFWASGTGKLWHFSKGKKQPSLITQNLPTEDLHIAFIDKDRMYLAAKTDRHHQNHAVYCYDLSKRQLTNISEKVNLQATPATINSDNEGNLWIPTDGDGLYYIRHIPYKYVRIKDITHTFINTIEADKQGRILLGTKNGLLRTNDSGHTVEEVLNGLDILSVHHSPYHPTFISSLFFSWHVDAPDIQYNIWKREVFHDTPEGHYYITPSQLSYWDAQTATDTIIQHLASYGEVGAGVIHQGIAYIATSNGLIGLELAQANASVISFKPWEEKYAISRVYDMLSTEKGLWIASNAGLFLWKDEVFTRFGTEQGLPSNQCFHLLEDYKGHLWVGTLNGLAKKLTKRNEDSWEIHNKQTGLQSNNITALYEDRHHQLWVGSVKGATIIDLDIDNSNLKEFPFYLYPSMGRELPKGQSADFHFKALYYANPETIVYAYRLDGEAWRETKQDLATYDALAAGWHTFEVKAKGLNDTWTAAQVYEFEVIPPWYERPWVLGMGMLLTFSSIMLITQNRVRKARKAADRLQNEINQRMEMEQQLSDVRRHIARDFHDEMGNKLASITVLSNLINFKLQQPSQEVADLLKKIEDSSKQLYRGTKDFIWAIDPKSDNLQELFTYLRDFGETFFQPLDIDFYVETQGGELFKEVTLPINWSRQLLLVGKEAMTNVAKYANSQAVWLIFRWCPEKHILSFTVKDTGNGFDIHTVKKGHGLRNMSERIKNIGGNLEINSTSEGTSVSVLVHTPQNG